MKKEIIKLEKMIKKIDEFQKHAPQGCLKIQNKNSRTYFYQQYMNEQTKQWDRKYIKKENSSLAKSLAQKHYYTIIKPVLENNLSEMKNFIKRYQPEAMQKIYDGLSIERRTLISPLQETVEERIRKWHEEEYEKNKFYPENLKFETDQGEMVRSKSEVIIANILYQHRNDILYKYERPLKMMIGGTSKTVYPDFTILNVHTGKIMYWEHAGIMDDSNYANEFVKKINTYIHNDLFPGKDVIFTYESFANPLEISTIRKIVNGIK